MKAHKLLQPGNTDTASTARNVKNPTREFHRANPGRIIIKLALITIPCPKMAVLVVVHDLASRDCTLDTEVSQLHLE